jgi:outer membrane murein-binding lipoprotein Lpp
MVKLNTLKITFVALTLLCSSGCERISEISNLRRKVAELNSVIEQKNETIKDLNSMVREQSKAIDEYKKAAERIYTK